MGRGLCMCLSVPEEPGTTGVRPRTAGRTSLAERGHSCPQQLPNASLGRFVARSPQSPLLRTGMSALRAKHVQFNGFPSFFRTTQGVLELTLLRTGASRHRHHAWSSNQALIAPGARPDPNLTGSLWVSYGLPYGLRLKKDQCLCGSLRVYGSNTPIKRLGTNHPFDFQALYASGRENRIIIAAAAGSAPQSR